MRKLLSLIILVVAAVVGYNYFMGDASEKASSKKIIEQVKDVGRSVGDLIKSEREKVDEGKYDAVLDKLGGLYKKARKAVSNVDEKLLEQIDKLDEERSDLELKKEEIEKDLKEQGDEASESLTLKKKKLEKSLKNLVDRTQKLLEQIDEK